MYKVMLVDDEIWVLRGLMKTIPWNEMGFEVIYYTTDSEKARDNLFLLSPDAVITDIRMASVSGIDLLEYAAEMETPPEFVLISAYEEFDYAHKALKLGAFDYLIKPLKKTEMLSVLEKLRDTLDGKVKNRRGELAKEIFELHEEVEAGEFFDRLHIKRKSDRFRVFGCAKRMFDMQTVINLFKDAFGESFALIEDGQFVYCIWNMEENKETEERKRLRDGAAEHMLFLGDGGTMGADDLIYSRICLARCAALQFLIETADVVTLYDEKNRLPKTDAIYHTLQEAFAAKKGERILHLVKDMAEFIRKNHYTIQDLIGIGNYICINLPGKEDYFQKNGVESIPAFLDRYRNIEDYVSDIADSVKAAFPDMEKETIGAEELKKYVDQHYTDKILVADIAEHFHMDLNYISRLFRKKYEKSLKDYLTERRMEKAVYLLDNTGLKIYEVAEASGYSDYFYFTRVFRKITGLTPTEWRERKDDEA